MILKDDNAYKSPSKLPLCAVLASGCIISTFILNAPFEDGRVTATNVQRLPRGHGPTVGGHYAGA